MNRQRILAAVYRYGESISVETPDGEIETKGYIEPLRYKNKMYVGGKQRKNGYRDGGHFLMICPKKTDFTVKGITIRRKNGESFVVKRADDVYFEGQVLYVWAILMPYYGQKEDAYE